MLAILYLPLITFTAAFQSPCMHSRYDAALRQALLATEPTTIKKYIQQEDESHDSIEKYILQEYQYESQDSLPVFPMDLIVNHDEVKQAIMAAVVSGQSIIVAGSTGTCKSVLIRSVQNLLPNYSVVHIPATISQDALTGSIDLESSMETGVPKFQPGLLQKAHNSIVLLDDVNLMDDTSGSVLFSALSDGLVRVEREGISVSYPCQPKIVLATYNDDYEEMNSHFLDRFGVQVFVGSQFSIPDRLQVVDNWEAYAEKKVDAILTAVHRNEIRRHQLQDASLLLSKVKIDPRGLQFLCSVATAFDCEGQRGEVAALHIAKALAALNGRSTLKQSDLDEAVRLCIVPRARVIPDMEPQSTQQETTEEESPPPQEKPQETTADDSQPESEMEPPEIIEIPDEMLFGVDTSIQIDQALLAFAQQLHKKKGRGGKRKPGFNIDRGKFVKAVFPTQDRRGRLAVGATLRAAAPYQLRRKLRKRTSKLIHITKDDFRIQLLKKKTGSLIIFLVDSSGSMALNRMAAAKGAAMTLLQEAYKSRDKVSLISFHGKTADVLVPPTKSMALARSRLEAMPCGSKTPLADALAKSVAMGMNAMKVKRDSSKVIVVLVSDCRPNVPHSVSRGEEEYQNGIGDGASRQSMKNEVLQIAKTIGATKDFDLLVIDTEDKFVGTGFGREIARYAQGNYYHLGVSASQESISRAVSNAQK